MRSLLYSGILGVALFCGSCIDKSDYELDGVTLDHTDVIKLVKGQLKISDILNNEDSLHLQSYDDGLLYVTYDQEIKSQDIRTLFDIPAAGVTKSFLMPGATIPPHSQDIRSDSIVTAIDLGMSPEQLTEMALKAGQVDFSVTISPPSAQLNYQVYLALPGFKSRTANKSLNRIISGTGIIDLSDYTATLINNRFDLKLVLVFNATTTTTVIPPATSININLNFNKFQFNYLQGFLGDQTVSLDPQSTNISVFDSDVFKGATISLAQPQVGFTVVNGNGVPVTVNFIKLEGRKPGANPLKVGLNPTNPVALQYPTTMGQTASTNISVTNVKELLDYRPTELYYQADARINQGLNSGNNFVLDTSQLRVKLHLEVPLYGSASGIVLQDTIDTTLDNVESSQISSASLKLAIINQFPLDGDIQFILTDDNYVPIGTLLLPSQIHIIRGATVDAQGDLAAAGQFIDDIELDKTKIEDLFKAKHIILSAALQTSRDVNGNATDVKFKADYTLKVDAGLSATLKLNVK
jgi:hypothetical protein